MKAGGWVPLSDLANVWQPSRLKGIQVSEEFGTPFLAATQVFDARPRPRKWLSLNRTSHSTKRFVAERTILITCSGSVGRATLAHATTEGILVSHDILRVEPKEFDWWGWIYAYLRVPMVREMMRTAEYGHIIKHLETQHLDALPIVTPRNPSLLAECNRLAGQITEYRDRSYRYCLAAEAEYADAIGPLPEAHAPPSAFTIKARNMFSGRRRLKASYYNPVAATAEAAIRNAVDRVETLEDLTERVFVPGRFKHVYGDGGVPQLDSADILENAPEVAKLVLSLKGEKRNNYTVDSGTLLLPCSGQLHGIIGSVGLATSWHENKVITNHVLRIVPRSDSPIRFGYLQAVLSHPILGRPRILRSAYGSSVPELCPDDLCKLPVPRLPDGVEDKIADKFEFAADLRGQADELEQRLAFLAGSELEQYLSSSAARAGVTAV